MADKRDALVKSVDENGHDLGMLVGFAFRWCDRHEKWEEVRENPHVFDPCCTLEYAERFIEAHRAKCLALSAHGKVKALKNGPEDEDGEPIDPKKYRGIYQWLPFPNAVRVADISWEEYPEESEGLNLGRLLGGGG